MPRLDVVGPDELDLDRYARLQRDSFAEVVGGTGMESTLRPERYAWKYRSGAGDARIALVTHGADLLAANAMVPFEIHWKGGRFTAWQSCDTATHPSARGQGHFSRCIRALDESLGADAVFFGFPNRNSAGGFAKLGWTVKAEIPTWARALPGGRTARARDISPLALDDPAIDVFAGRLAATPNALAARDRSYLAWRYGRCPVARYEAFALRRDGAIDGIVVLRTATVSGRAVAAAMDVLAPSRADDGRLLAFASAWAAEKGARWAVAMHSSLAAGTALRRLWVRVPGLFLPKRQVLMGAARGAGAACWSRPWTVQLGDWDAF